MIKEIDQFIKNSRSQASQDIFVQYICDTTNGYFLDIGSYDPIQGNNTYALEKSGWSGICFDITDYSENYKNIRTSKFICGDVIKIDFSNILSENNVPKVIDYISIDVDNSTEKFLDIFPFEQYEFKVITFEHDSYVNGDELKNKSRDFFKKRGYKLLCSDVAVTYNTQNDYFEDWYVNEKYIDRHRIEKMECDKYHHLKIVELIKNESRNKECVILQYYISDYIDEYILNGCIDSISQFGLDIFLISHSPVSKEIQKKVKYFMYDSDDELITFEDIFYEKAKLWTDKRFSNDSIEVSPFLFIVDDISYSFCKAIYDIYLIVNAMGYKYSYYFTGDFKINKDEIIELKKISELVSSEDKKGYFEEYSASIMNAFFWYVDNKWFLENFFLNMNSKDEFLVDLKKLNLYCHHDLYVDYQVRRNIENLIVKKVDYSGHPFVSQDRSDLSKKIKPQKYDEDIGIFYLNDIPYLFYFDYERRNHKWKIYIEYDNNEISKYSISNGDVFMWRMYPIEIKYNKFTIKCFNEENNKLRYSIYINDLDMYKRKFKIINK